MDISSSKIPRFLSKYYSNHEYILDVLLNKRLYHSLPSEFNDHFDCRPLISLQYSNRNDAESWMKYFYYLAKLQDENLSEDELKKCANTEIKNGTHKNISWLKEADTALKSMLEEAAKKIRVCCFSKSPRNMMLWALYAEKHNGVVFQFRSSFLYDEKSNSFKGHKVSYKKSAINVCDLSGVLEKGYEYNDVLAMARMSYRTKLDYWRGENEVRFFTTEDKEYLSFEESALSAIIFGNRCPNSFVEEIIMTISNWKEKPLLFKASVEKSKNKLRIMRYNPDKN